MEVNLLEYCLLKVSCIQAHTFVMISRVFAFWSIAMAHLFSFSTQRSPPRLILQLQIQAQLNWTLAGADDLILVLNSDQRLPHYPPKNPIAYHQYSSVTKDIHPFCHGPLWEPWEVAKAAQCAHWDAPWQFPSSFADHQMHRSTLVLSLHTFLILHPTSNTQPIGKGRTILHNHLKSPKHASPDSNPSPDYGSWLSTETHAWWRTKQWDGVLSSGPINTNTLQLPCPPYSAHTS